MRMPKFHKSLKTEDSLFESNSGGTNSAVPTKDLFLCIGLLAGFGIGVGKDR